MRHAVLYVLPDDRRIELLLHDFPDFPVSVLRIFSIIGCSYTILATRRSASDNGIPPRPFLTNSSTGMNVGGLPWPKTDNPFDKLRMMCFGLNEIYMESREAWFDTVHGGCVADGIAVMGNHITSFSTSLLKR